MKDILPSQYRYLRWIRADSIRFSQLTVDQQGIVNRVINELMYYHEDTAVLNFIYMGFYREYRGRNIS